MTKTLERQPQPPYSRQHRSNGMLGFTIPLTNAPAVHVGLTGVPAYEAGGAYVLILQAFSPSRRLLSVLLQLQSCPKLTTMLLQLPPCAAQPHAPHVRSSVNSRCQVSRVVDAGQLATSRCAQIFPAFVFGTHAYPISHPLRFDVVAHNFMLVVQVGGSGIAVPALLHASGLFATFTRHAGGVSMLMDAPIGPELHPGFKGIAAITCVPPMFVVSAVHAVDVG